MEATAVPSQAPRLLILFTLDYYGTGYTVAEARANCVKAGGGRNLRTWGHVVKALPKGVSEARMDDMGAIIWTRTITVPGQPPGVAELVEDKRTKRARRRQER